MIVTADHGEILNEQLGYYDHHGLYEGNIHVPLIFLLAGQAAQRASACPASCRTSTSRRRSWNWPGVRDRDNMEGISLLPAIFGVRDGNYDELYLVGGDLGSQARDIVTDRWKLIDSIEQDPHGRPMQELFDLDADPDEQHNVIDLATRTSRVLSSEDQYLGRRCDCRKPVATRTRWWCKGTCGTRRSARRYRAKRLVRARRRSISVQG